MEIARCQRIVIRYPGADFAIHAGVCTSAGG